MDANHLAQILERLDVSDQASDLATADLGTPEDRLHAARKLRELTQKKKKGNQ